MGRGFGRSAPQPSVQRTSVRPQARFICIWTAPEDRCPRSRRPSLPVCSSSRRLGAWQGRLKNWLRRAAAENPLRRTSAQVKPVTWRSHMDLRMPSADRYGISHISERICHDDRLRSTSKLAGEATGRRHPAPFLLIQAGKPFIVPPCQFGKAKTSQLVQSAGNTLWLKMRGRYAACVRRRTGRGWQR